MPACRLLISHSRACAIFSSALGSTTTARRAMARSRKRLAQPRQHQVAGQQQRQQQLEAAPRQQRLRHQLRPGHRQRQQRDQHARPRQQRRPAPVARVHEQRHAAHHRGQQQHGQPGDLQLRQEGRRARTAPATASAARPQAPRSTSCDAPGEFFSWPANCCVARNRQAQASTHSATGRFGREASGVPPMRQLQVVGIDHRRRQGREGGLRQPVAGLALAPAPVQAPARRPAAGSRRAACRCGWRERPAPALCASSSNSTCRFSSPRPLIAR